MKRIKHIPNSPGIYLFYNSQKKLIYIGKATSLRNRVRSYFAGQRTPRPIEQMIHEVKDIKWKETDSVLEAIILEANFIKKFQPKYNVIGKDNKSWNYIVITSDEYPKVMTMRSHELEQSGNKQSMQSKSFGELRIKQTKYLFGPYPGLNTKATMKLLRRLFYISTCQPKAKRPCLYYQMGQCLGVCTGEISPTEYKKKVIKPLVTFLQGGKKLLIATLEKTMLAEAKAQNFEEAARLRNQIKGLKRIHDIALLNESFFDDKSEIINHKSKIHRVEGYDISNLGASGKVGSMVVFTNSEPDKGQYRKFKIKTVVGQSDVDCLEEVITRRLRHARKGKGERGKGKVDFWPLPDLFLIDGGKPQVNRVQKVLFNFDIKVPVVGIAKGPERKKNEFVISIKGKGERGKGKNERRELVKWVDENKRLLIQVRDEAHRFAIAYQRKLR